MTSKVNRKTGILTPCRSETPENFITKIGHIDYVAGGNMPSKLLTVRSDVDDLRTRDLSKAISAGIESQSKLHLLIFGPLCHLLREQVEDFQIWYTA